MVSKCLIIPFDEQYMFNILNIAIRIIFCINVERLNYEKLIVL